MTKPANPYARRVNVELTDVELLALTHALDRALDANAEWQKCERYEADAPAEEAALLAKGDAVLTRLRDAYKAAKPRTAVRVTCDTGKTWTAEINGTMADAEKYFLRQVFTEECLTTGKETRHVVTMIENLNA